MIIHIFMLLGFFLVCLSTAGDAKAKEMSVESACRAMVEHQPDPDVNYHPGMQVQGEFDVPVDLENSLQPTHEVIKIPVTVDLAQAFGLPVPAGVELKPDVAMMEIHQDGRVTYNGQDVTSSAREKCGQPTSSRSTIKMMAPDDVEGEVIE